MSNSRLVYLDSSFLVSYFIEDHQKRKVARKLFAQALVHNKKLVLSALTLDEAIHHIYGELRRKEKLDKNLKHLPDKPHKDYSEQLCRALDTILDTRFSQVIQFNADASKGCKRAMDNISNFTMNPRDAFHLSYMQDHFITKIITFDSDFDGVSEVSVVKSKYDYEN